MFLCMLAIFDFLVLYTFFTVSVSAFSLFISPPSVMSSLGVWSALYLLFPTYLEQVEYRFIFRLAGLHYIFNPRDE